MIQRSDAGMVWRDARAAINDSTIVLSPSLATNSQRPKAHRKRALREKTRSAKGWPRKVNNGRKRGKYKAHCTRSTAHYAAALRGARQGGRGGSGEALQRITEAQPGHVLRSSALSELHDTDRHVDRMGATAQNHAAQQRHVTVVTSIRQRYMIPIRQHVVGRIEIDPTEVRAPDRHPRV